MSFQDSIINAYEKIRKSVVSISSTKIIDFLFFSQPVKGIGSGVVIDENGLIVTNAHVVKGFEKLEVTLPSGESYKASIVGMDRRNDIALIRIPKDGIEPAELGDSDTLRIGQLVIAIGNPFSHILGGPSVTLGIISGLDRTIRAGDIVFENLIQTDAAINPGNSGGPLVDLEGRVIGITTAMIPFAQGIGFAIPINEVKYIVEQLLKYGKVYRPWIGIYTVDLNPMLAREIGAPIDKGALIVGVVPGSPAHYAGLRRGDIVLKVDDTEIKKASDLASSIRRKGIGNRILLTVARGYAKYTVEVTIEGAPS